MLIFYCMGGIAVVDRTILHCDLNSFFASVELLDHPELRVQPVAVCGDPSARHGIILAKNEPAKAQGVQTAETICRPVKSAPLWCCYPPTTRSTALIPNGSTRSFCVTPIW